MLTGVLYHGESANIIAIDVLKEPGQGHCSGFPMLGKEIIPAEKNVALRLILIGPFVSKCYRNLPTLRRKITKDTLGCISVLL